MNGACLKNLTSEELPNQTNQKRSTAAGSTPANPTKSDTGHASFVSTQKH